MSTDGLIFPLVNRAEAAGVLDGQSALVVGPTATGKSYIGQQAIFRAVTRREPGTNVYLVPFRALASEIYDTFLELLAGTSARVRITTGDHRDPIRPEDADLVVATYESFAALLARPAFRPGIVVADEVHLIADDHRGPVVEGIFARLLASKRLRALCGLSAVIENGPDLAKWLGIPLLEGSAADRAVPLALSARLVGDVEEGLLEILQRCTEGKQALVFCSSRNTAERTAEAVAATIRHHGVKAADRAARQKLARTILEADPGADDLVELVQAGVAYHHAGLPKAIRQQLEGAFRDRHLRAITATPTLAAGVNLPVDIAVVKDVFRGDVVRGVFKRVLLPSGEVLNMLGRAARPHQVERGQGIALIDKRHQRDPDVKALIAAIKAGRGAPVESRLPDSFEGLMRFVLAVIAERGEATWSDVTAAFTKTLAYYEAPSPLETTRPFEEDLMEDLPSYRKVVEARGAIRLKQYTLSPAGVQATIDSSGKRYEVVIAVTGVKCSCPAASQFYRNQPCKHQACAIHDLLFKRGVDPEARNRTIYNCAHVFRRTLDTGTKLSLTLDLLVGWRLIERIPTGWRATPIGQVAALPGFDLLLVHQAVHRLGATRARPDYRTLARWAVEDYFAEEKDEQRWLRALEPWLDEVDLREIPMPVKYRGDFEQRVEDLARVCLLYERAALAMGRNEIADAARGAAGAVRYGVAPELVPLMALALAQLARARSRYLFDKGVRNLQDLANADPVAVADPRRAPEALVRQWVARATEIFKARAVASADREEADPEFDELVARFRIDPMAIR